MRLLRAFVVLDLLSRSLPSRSLLLTPLSIRDLTDFLLDTVASDAKPT